MRPAPRNPIELEMCLALFNALCPLASPLLLPDTESKYMPCNNIQCHMQRYNYFNSSDELEL